jgi:preprotein translocase subunit SecE
VARETRRQRRDARRAAGADEAAARTPSRRPVADGGAAVPASVEPIHREERRRGGFVRESVGELRKVDWPNRNQVIQGTVVVLIACAIVGAFLYGADLALRPFVRDVLIGV